MTNSEIGVRIKHRREQLGLTQQQIADAISVTKSTIQRYETGKIEKIKIPVIAAIARALSCNPSWIIGKSESPVLENTDEIYTQVDIESRKNNVAKLNY